MENNINSAFPSVISSGVMSEREIDASKNSKLEVAQLSLQKQQEGIKEQQNADNEQRRVDDKEQVEEVVASINQLLEVQNRDVKFVVDERDGQFFTSVLNKSTDELIREIPSEEYRKLQERLRNFQEAIGETTGLFVDQLV